MNDFVQDGTCPEEKVQRGPLGAVLNDEIVARIVRRPEHLKGDEVKPGLFPRTHIAKTGLSVTRVNRIERNDFIAYAEAVAHMKPGQEMAGIVLAEAGSVRSLKTAKGETGFCVIEDPAIGIERIPDNPAHAVVVASSVVSPEDEDKLIEIQTLLMRVFSSLQQI